MDTVLWLCPSLPTETLKWLSSLPILMQESFWWWQCSDRYIVSLSPHLHAPFPPPFSPSLISLMVSVDVKHHVYFLHPVLRPHLHFASIPSGYAVIFCHSSTSFSAAAISHWLFSRSPDEGPFLWETIPCLKITCLGALRCFLRQISL